MVELEIDGHKVSVEEGCMVMHAAEQAGVTVPHFCYHKKLSVAANCRMCLVEVEKAPKPLPACATPVSQGMVVRTMSEKAVAAQKSVMEFLLLNHPLDCPVCDQGGECQLQDLAMGYGSDHSLYHEEKRVVQAKDVGPLISMEEMSRCIHCTRCVRFGQEIAGVMELGMSHRGGHSEIETFLGASIDSEVSGNMIDLCPVGALTSKPFRYQARTWELSRRKSISPHDSTGANLVVQVKNNRVMRVLPLENEAVNECWLADRDRFSYPALYGPDRLLEPMIQQNGQWITVDWETALQTVVNGWKAIQNKQGAGALGAIVSPHSTLEELYLAQALVRGLGSENVDYRGRHADFVHPPGVRWLGRSIASLSELDRVFLVGSNLRKDHPLFSLRIRQAARQGAQILTLGCPTASQWAMPVVKKMDLPLSHWGVGLADIACFIAAEKGIAPPIPLDRHHPDACDIALALLTGKNKAVLLGNAAAHHAHASGLLTLANWIAKETGATVGYLTEAANTVGAEYVRALPGAGGLDATAMLSGTQGLRGLLLLGHEPRHDSVLGQAAVTALAQMDMVVTLSPFKTNLECSHVLLPIAPFTETAGTFINAEARVQSFYAVTKPHGLARPAWKVLRVLGDLMGLLVSGFEAETIEQVRSMALAGLAQDEESWGALSEGPRSVFTNFSNALLNLENPVAAPCSASIYQLDSLVRRSPVLQATVDAQMGMKGVAQ